MPSKNPAQRLNDILEHIAAVNEFIEGLAFDQFSKDRKTVFAVLRALEVISEASRRLPSEVKERHQEIDWHAIAAAGNIWRHEYDAVDNAIVWKTAKNLDHLRSVVEAELQV